MPFWYEDQIPVALRTGSLHVYFNDFFRTSAIWNEQRNSHSYPRLLKQPYRAAAITAKRISKLTLLKGYFYRYM
jgi:hypothetical protein